MKYNKILILAGTLGLVATSCASGDYDQTIPTPQPPYQAEMDARLSAYGTLDEYMSAFPGMKMGVSVKADTYAAHEMVYGIIKTNFGQVEAFEQCFPISLLNTETGEYELAALTTLAEAAAKDGMSVFGPALNSRQNIPDDYIKSLIADVVIPYQPWAETIMVTDFEDQAVGTKFGSSKKNAGSVAVEITEDPVQGKVLTGTKLTMDVPKIDVVQLPQGFTLADVSRVLIKCKVESGTPTTSRLQIEGAGYNEKANPYSNKGVWEEYVFDLSNIKFSAAQLALNKFNLAAGAQGSGVTASIDDIRIVLNHNDGDDTVISKTDAEKTEIVGAMSDKWVESVIAASSNAVTDYIIYDEPLDDTEDAFNWEMYLGSNYLANIQAKVNAASATPVRYFVSQSIIIGENTSDDIDDVMQFVASLEKKGVKVDGVNFVVSAPFNEDYVAQIENDANIVKAMEHLATVDKLVRIANFKVTVTGDDGSLVMPSRLNTVERQAVAEAYQKALAAYIKGAGQNAAGFSLSTPVDTDSEVAPWMANGNRNFVYEGIVRALGAGK